MAHNRQTGARRESPHPARPAALTAVAALRRYSAGEIGPREAAEALGPLASEHDVLAALIAADLPLPSPPAAQVAREVERLRALYGAAKMES